MTNEWLVTRDGATWTDRLNSEAECLFHIQESVEKDTIFDEDDYEYRVMTKEELDKYKPRTRSEQKKAIKAS